MSRQIADRFFENIDLTDVKLLHTFIPIGKFNEVDTALIYEKIWRDRPEIGTVAPRTDLLRGDLESVAFDRSTRWTENDWGIREPVGGEIVEAEKIDIVLVPLLCFDQNGHRVGYGKGMYDRFLAECRSVCLKVGLSFLPPVETITAISIADVRLDACITPDRIYKAKGCGP